MGTNSSWMGEHMLIVVIAVVVLLLVIIIIGVRNKLVEKEKKVERNESLIDVYLKKRFDLIPNLVEVCKGYAKHESETLAKVAELRSAFEKNPNNENREELNEVYKKFVALVESYPELKASDNYLKLQKELTNAENEIQASRRIYINSITDYNNMIMKFPSSIVAGLFGFKKKTLPKYDYSDVKVDFNKGE